MSGDTPQNPFFTDSSPLFELTQQDYRVSNRIAKLGQMFGAALQTEIKWPVFTTDAEGKPRDSKPFKTTLESVLTNKDQIFMMIVNYDLQQGQLGELLKNSGSGTGKAGRNGGSGGGDKGSGGGFGGIKPVSDEDLR